MAIKSDASLSLGRLLYSILLKCSSYFRIMAQEEKADSSSFNQDDLPGRCRYVHVQLAINTIKGNIS